jgi:hypothetical protein
MHEPPGPKHPYFIWGVVAAAVTVTVQVVDATPEDDMDTVIFPGAKDAGTVN